MSEATVQDVEALQRRVLAAIWAADVSREAIEFDWPECHRPRCAGRHGSPDSAFGLMKSRIAGAVEDELRFRMLTRPDVAVDGDSPEDAAALTLAVLLARYQVRDAGTFAKAARLIVDAYPGLVPVLAGIAGIA